MNEVMLIKLLNEAIPLFLLIVLGFALYQGLRKNQTLVADREGLLRRYLLFRGDKQVRLKIYGEDEQVYRDLLKNLSASWKNFKKNYDEYFFSVAKNTKRTKHFLEIITLGLLVNSGRLLVEEYYFFGIQARFLCAVAKELPSYVLVIVGFFLLKAQTHEFLSSKGNGARVEREILFFPNHLSPEGEQKVLYDEFDPLERAGGEDSKEAQDSSR